MEGHRGAPPKELFVYDLKARSTIDRELTEHAIDFMGREVRAGKPYFAFIPYTNVHHPNLADTEFKGKTRNGDFADVPVQMNAYVGRMLDAVSPLMAQDYWVRFPLIQVLFDHAASLK